MKAFRTAKRDNILGSMMVVGLVAALYLISQSNYLLFHSLAEIFSIVVAGSIFIVYWNSRHFVENNFFAYVAIAYLFVSLIGLLHTLAYKGMGVFPAQDANLPTQLWIAARYLESFALLAAVLFLKQKCKPALILHSTAVFFILIMGTIFGGIFPDCYVEGMGLTRFKIISEYLISLILMVTIWQLYRKKTDFDPAVFSLLIASLVFNIFAELAFTFYISVSGLSNFVGHIFKIASFYLIYKALPQTALTKPYKLLFREHKEREAKLEQSEEKYYNLFTHANDSIFIIHPQTYHILDANESAAEKLGYTRDEILQLSIFDIVHPLAADQNREVFENLLARGSAAFESVHRHQDGSEMPVDVTSRVIKYGGHQVYQSIARDITERKQTERMLKESTEQLQYNNIELENRVAARTQALELRTVQVNSLNQAMTNLLTDLKANQKIIENSQAELEQAHHLLKKERVQEQAVLLRFSQELLTDNEISTILDWSVRELAVSFEVSHAVIALVSADGQNYTHLVRHGWTAEQMGLHDSRPFEPQNDFGRVLLSGSPLVISDWELFPDLTPSTFLKAAGIQSSLIVPMIVAEKALGVMAVDSLVVCAWTEDEVRLLSLLANTTAQAIARARLYSQVSDNRQRLQALSSQLSEAQETERRRISRELHDQIGQALTVVKITLQSLEYLPDAADRDIYLQRSLTATDRAIQQVRNLSLDLRPSVLDDLGLPAALRWFLKRQKEITDLSFDLDVPEFAERLPEPIETICYRVLQEACTNVLRHAAANRVVVKVWQEAQELFMDIQDDGIGFDLEQALKAAEEGRSLGLINMQERVELAAGKIKFISQPGQGTEIRIRLPLAADKSGSE